MKFGLHWVFHSSIPRITIPGKELDPKVPDKLTLTAFPYLLEDTEKKTRKTAVMIVDVW
jgi:hypothetical protein